MHKCKSGRHAWLNKSDAEKCCNGWTRILVLNTPSAANQAYDAKAQTSYGRAWIKTEHA